MTTAVAEQGRVAVRRNGFAAASVSFVMVFAAGATAIPLYPTYRAVDGVTDAQFSLVSVGYFVGAIFSLLVLGRTSNHLGRRPVGAAALVVAMLGCLVLLVDHGFTGLLLGRILQGLAAGLASSALAAYAVDSAPEKPRWLAGLVSSAGNVAGLTVGVFASGALVQFAPQPRSLVFEVFLVVLGLCAVWVLTRHDTVDRRAGLARSLVPSLVVPLAAKPLLLGAGAVFVSTWAIGGYFQAFGSSVATDYLGSSAPLVAACVFASYNGAGVIGGPLAGILSPRATQRVAMAVVVVAVLGLVIAAATASAPLFIGAGVLGGIGMGAGMNASIGRLLPTALPSQRAGLLAVVYVISYGGSAVPGLLAGQATHVLSLLAVTVGYSALTVAGLIVVLVATRLRRRA